MSMDRRSVLRGLAAAGLSVSGLSWAQPGVPAQPAADAAARPDVTTLVAGGALDAAFLAGVRDAVRGQGQRLATQPVQGLEAATYQRLDALLNDGEPTLLVGLVDDAAATLVLDLVRTAGGRVLSVQHHRVAAGAAGSAWAGALGRALVAPAPVPTVAVADPHGTAYVALSCVI